MSVDVSPPDAVDRQIIHALSIEPRAPFRTLGRVVGISDQTAARRYRRLQHDVGLRVLGTVEGPRVGWVEWMIRLQCTPGAAGDLADALTRRDDTRWVQLASGGTEIVFVVQARNPQERNDLFLKGLPGSRRVVQISAHSLLHKFSPHQWKGIAEALSEDQIAELVPTAGCALPDHDAPPVPLDDTDQVLLAHLAVDGRTSAATLAQATNWHESTVRRRIEQLLQSGALIFDIDVDPAGIGAPIRALLWLSVEPAQLVAVGESIASHPEVPFVAATTGPTNLVASVACRDTGHLYQYLTSRLQSLPGLRSVETAPLIHTFKQAGAVRPPRPDRSAMAVAAAAGGRT
jgi:DNA-binding Lrp family transcriptional regulator